FFSSRRRHTRFSRDWSSDVCSSDLSECFATKNGFIYVMHSQKDQTMLPSLRVITLQGPNCGMRMKTASQIVCMRISSSNHDLLKNYITFTLIPISSII